jgi:hypothetical protein
MSTEGDLAIACRIIALAGFRRYFPPRFRPFPLK